MEVALVDTLRADWPLVLIGAGLLVWAGLCIWAIIAPHKPDEFKTSQGRRLKPRPPRHPIEREDG